MLQKILIEVFERDLTKLKDELSAYENEEKLWVVTAGINNSGGNLALHLIGNLNHFIGATLGNTGYVRNRDAEFALKNIPRADILADIDKTKDVVTKTLIGLTDEQLEEIYPTQQKDVAYFLVHLATHLSYHLGQINYHRRLVG